jgi:hypothetical protein
VPLKRWLPLALVVLCALFWYARTWYVGSSASPAGDGSWAADTLTNTMTWGGYEFLYAKYVDTTFIFLHSLYAFTFLLPLVIGVRHFQSRGVFPKGVKLWFLIGMVVFLGVWEKNWRYPLFFLLPIPLLLSRGLFRITEKLTQNALLLTSLVFLVTFPALYTTLLATFPPLLSYLKEGMVLALLVSTLVWLALAYRDPLHTVIQRVDRRLGSKRLTGLLVVFTLLLAGSTTVLQYSAEYAVPAVVTDLHEAVRADASQEQVLLSVGTKGLYYFTGVNTLHILYPDELAVLKPLVDAPDLEDGVRFLLHDLNVGSIVFPSESVGRTREWFVSFLHELPSLRVLYNPQLFETSLHTPRYFYFLTLTNASMRSFGVLDVVVQGSDPTHEASLLLPMDYGTRRTWVAYSREVNLTTFLYFPRDLIEMSLGAASIETSVNLTTTTRLREDQLVVTSSEIRTQSRVNLSKIMQVHLGELRGHDDSVYTSIGIDSIAVHVNHPTFHAHFHLAPPQTSQASLDTLVTYFPAPSSIYQYPNQTWTHSGFNLIETNASLTVIPEEPP